MASAITPKTASATAGAGASAPLSILVIWLIEMIPANNADHHIVIPATVAAAIGSIMAAALAFGGAWLAPRSEPTQEQVTQILQTAALQQNTPQNQNWNTQA